MGYIDIYLMHMPQVYLDGKIVHFSYKKAEALFYYIAVEKKITRDQAASMFWYDCDDEIAKKNLRQSIYVLKRTFGYNVIVSLPNHMLGFSDKYAIRCDLDVFYEKCDLGLYKGEIFRGFYVKDAALFEEWLSKIRERVRKFYLSNYLEYMKAIPPDKLYVLEEHFNRYINEDPFEERAYIIMLQSYWENGLYHKGVQLYQKLCTCLDDELGIGPTSRTTELYYRLLDSMAGNKEEGLKPVRIDVKLHEQSFEGKGLVYKAQLKELYAFYAEYLGGKGRAVLLSGEIGVGRMFLTTEFFETYAAGDMLILKTTCYMKNKKLILQPWNDLMLQLQKHISQRKIDIPYNLAKAVNRLVPAFDITGAVPLNKAYEKYDYTASKNGILQTLILVARQIKLIILFENIHSMDPLSLDIFTGLVHTARQKIFILCTALDVVDSDTESFMNAAYNSRKLVKIPLPPLSFEETEKLSRAKSVSFDITEDQIREIYKHSQGNLFFIREFLWNIKNRRTLDEFPPGVQGILNDQIDGLSDPSLQLLNVISIFLEYVALDELCYIQNENAVIISRQLDELKERRLISERIIDDRVCFVFNQYLMRNFIYSKIPSGKKRRLHELAGIVCENASYDLKHIYHFLIHHYSLSGNHPKALLYRIKKLPGEILPDYKAFIHFTEEAKSELSPQAYLQSLLDELMTTRERQPEALEYDHLEAGLLLAKSRCCLLSGEMKTGMEAFSMLLHGSYIWTNPRVLFEANLQLMDYTVQNAGKNSCVEWEEMAEFAKPLEKAIYNQMQAIIAILSKDQDRARHLLDKVTTCILKSKK